ncbi:MAG: glycosyltransferase family 4 protein [Anaerolineaceae bacterium]|nr:glycosyltransferase family 4 protein [Anaerolineaceae bacterium]
MKILYATGRYSPLQHDEGSGTDFRLYHALLDQGFDLEFVGPFDDTPDLLERFYRKAHALFSRRRPAKYTRAMLNQASTSLARAVKKHKPDLIFSKNLAPLVQYQASIPVVYMLDSTVAAFNRAWPTFSKFENRRMVHWEKKVLRQASAVITRSEWTRDSLIRDYGYPAEQIHIVHNSASLPPAVIPPVLELRPPDFTTVRLLFVGRVGYLKGIDIAIEITRLLNESGTPADLRIVGTSGSDQPHVHYAGSFRKSIGEELQAYADQYRWSHFLLHPARYDAAPIVTAEAAAFGVPTLTNAVGGIASTVEDGVSGIVLPANSPASEYVKVIQRMVTAPAQYNELRRTTRQRYEQELNWESAGRKIAAILRQVVSPQTDLP